LAKGGITLFVCGPTVCYQYAIMHVLAGGSTPNVLVDFFPCGPHLTQRVIGPAGVNSYLPNGNSIHGTV